jgi:ankyrin repeat protein
MPDTTDRTRHVSIRYYWMKDRVANGELEIVTLLVENNADINEPGSLRETALIKAVRARHAPIVTYLATHGADLDETDQTGASALDIAQRSRLDDIVDILKKAGSK